MKSGTKIHTFSGINTLKVLKYDAGKGWRRSIEPFV
jgi:hypothetical protein